MAYIELNNVTFTYPEAPGPALSSASLSIGMGEFVVLFGPSGSGKSTLLRLLKEEIRPHGKLDGTITTGGPGPAETGFVFQDPENQIVADDPLHEMVFGLENRGLPTNEMRSRVAEIVSFFGAETILHKKMHELSGGRKQQMNLASVLLMQPDILLLDEPASQLDPVSTRELFDMLKRLNEEFGMTIILAEHRLDDAVALADRLVMLEGGRIVQDGPPRLIMRRLWGSNSEAFIPSIPALFLREEKETLLESLPLSIKEGRSRLDLLGPRAAETGLETGKSVQTGEVLLFAKNLGFQYEKKNGPVIEDFMLELKRGELYALLGGNGSGKSTLLKLLSNVLKPLEGKVSFEGRPFKKWNPQDLAGKIAYLPQNPRLFFLHDSVAGEIDAACLKWGTDRSEAERLVHEFGLESLLNRHPYDLSGGELQKAAFLCLLLRKPDVFLLDEPTKGLDPISKKNLGSILQRIRESGSAILMATHDIEFAAKYATRCGMLFQGNITSEDLPESFFKGNFFYTTVARRLFRSLDKPGKKAER
ncbi:ATP-binding cassette domain-containing protein [Neobacillus sp. YIM B06451]|uniref:ABC transporter ATP-binding protein n=1 Tax=Neobacillus sp. YIM B06451 TaxID=3070994 RepID=UPI00292E2026|nr:ATP-binding cassette domain-containing protein [Neobacillus sp. YIM B06451]